MQKSHRGEQQQFFMELLTHKPFSIIHQCAKILKG